MTHNQHKSAQQENDEVTKTLSYHAVESNKLKVLLLTPTGSAAINIEGTTIHSVLRMQVGHFKKYIPQRNDKARS